MIRLVELFSAILFLIYGCNTKESIESKTAAELFADSSITAISFGGFRTLSRSNAPSIDELKEDLLILKALDIQLIRTYNTQLYDETAHLLQAIKELKSENVDFKMYVMLGAWIQCKGAFTATPKHTEEDTISNRKEIDQAIKYAKQYPDIIKVIAVGNEAMVHWAAPYFVETEVILKYVLELNQLKESGQLPKTLWITSSDNFASWGGESTDYHTEDLKHLIKSVDYVSIHTYPFHDTHYNPDFWRLSPKDTIGKSKEEIITESMKRAAEYAFNQFEQTKRYVHGVSPDKPIHIGESGWATASNGFYGDNGSHAADEFKQKLYYQEIRKRFREKNIKCFFFEAFDEPWKDAKNPVGSENHFGLINIKSQAKYVLWDAIDQGKLAGLSRMGKTITKTYDGNESDLISAVKIPIIAQHTITN